MYPALNMELEIVRTVLKNKINDIYVCTDLLKNTGTFYTMVSIRDRKIRRIVTEKLNTERLFFSNRDFVGSFTYGECLNLVFQYYHENLFSLMGVVYLEEFSDCKKAALNLITACAESGAGAEMGLLLLDEGNINITREGNIYFNYFLDFAKFQKDSDQEYYLNNVSEVVFSILELNYKGKYESPKNYPSDLRLFYLKINSGGITSMGHMISLIRGMADKPVEMRGFVGYIQNNFHQVKVFLFHNSMTTFLTILVAVTLIYAGVQIHNRWEISKAYENNVSYYGIEYIGNVYLGDEE